MKLPKYIQDVIDCFESLPGIGPKSAQRLGLYLIRLPEGEVLKFADSFKKLKQEHKFCSQCFNLSEGDLCEICSDVPSRDLTTICVVESPLDLIAFEKSGYRGVYHVLHGVINPIAGIGPDEIFLNQLFARMQRSGVVREIILATGTSLEGETTSMFISREIKARFPEITVSRLGKGLPVGADIEYADEGTLGDALSSRVRI
jgi:recombination protein RecR